MNILVTTIVIIISKPFSLSYAYYISVFFFIVSLQIYTSSRPIYGIDTGSQGIISFIKQSNWTPTVNWFQENTNCEKNNENIEHRLRKEIKTVNTPSEIRSLRLTQISQLYWLVWEEKKTNEKPKINQIVSRTTVITNRKSRALWWYSWMLYKKLCRLVAWISPKHFAPTILQRPISSILLPHPIQSALVSTIVSHPTQMATIWTHRYRALIR